MKEGRVMGTMILVRMERCPAPSILAASMVSLGTASKA